MARPVDADILIAALAGYEEARRQIEARIAELRKRVRSAMPRPVQTVAARAVKKHRLSAEGRARIAAAQKKRWAAAKKPTATASLTLQAVRNETSPATVL